MKLKVLAIGGYCEAIQSESALPNLKGLVSDSVGAPVRRITRFVQLALIGAGRCCKQVTISPDTAVYFSSCRGDTEVTATLLRDLIGRNESPSPLTFVNSVSNAACFHVAKALALHDRSNFVTNRFDPIVAALKTAYLDILLGETRNALIGSVDAVALPLSEHRQRTQVTDDRVLGEGSHWLLVAAESDPRPAIANIAAIHNFSSWEKLRLWLEKENQLIDEDTVLAPGQHLPKQDCDRVLASTGISEVFSYRESLPHYDSQTGAAIDLFIREGKNTGSMLHINSDPSGRYSALLVERLASSSL